MKTEKYICVIIFVLFFAITQVSICQIFRKDTPVSFSRSLQTNIASYNLNVQFSNIQENKRIEIIEDDTVEISNPIIGELFDVSINRNNNGTWTIVDNGDSLWQMQINSNTGDYMMLLFDDFYLPRGTKLFVYSADRTQVLGAFTEDNNVPSSKFTTSPLKTNSLIVEYYKPYYVIEQPRLNIKSVGLIDKSLTNILTREGGFGVSGNCQINAMCPQYDNWCNQRRSVAKIIINCLSTGKVYGGTGSLLTNEKRDGKPFFLTAFHCVDCDDNGSPSQSEKDDVQYWLFYFNYQSPGCDNPTTEPTLMYFISGATYLRGINEKNGTDYALLQLNKKPPPNYNVYYNGWSNDKDDMTNTGVCVHHPRGDIKKISEWEKVVSLRADYWKVKYTNGTTEDGSSGSPLFNSSGYVVGQLSSGTSACNYNNGRDFFGRFDKSWHDYGLCYELNPNGSHSGSYQNWYSKMIGGDDICKQNWYFNNCNDLHTSDNVSFLNSSTIGTRQYDGVYNAKNQITAENTNIQAGTGKTVIFEAGNGITLGPGFKVEAGAHFIARIGDCQLGCDNGRGGDEEDMVVFNPSNKPRKSTVNTPAFENEENIQRVAVYPNPNDGTFTITTNIDPQEIISVQVFSMIGQSIYKQSGLPNSTIQMPSSTSGMFYVEILTKTEKFVRKMVVF